MINFHEKIDIAKCGAGHSFVCPLKISFYLYEYVTISKTIDH